MRTFTFAFLALLCLAARAPDLNYELRAPTAPVLLGEWFEIVVEGALPDDVDLLLPAADAESSPDVIFGRPRSERLGAHRVLSVPVSVVRAGETKVSGLRLSGDDVTEALPPVSVEVQFERPAGFVPVVAERDASLAIPMPKALTWPFLAAIVTALVLLGAFVWKAGRVVVVKRVVQPAHLIASAALAGLRARVPEDPEAVRAMVADVSGVLRRYIEARFSLHASARTTEEFLAEAAGREGALGAHREPLAEFLTSCDLATYAGVHPGRQGLIELLDAAEGFVETTRHTEQAS
ncbi:MAG: hypothetical protein DHS20C15_27650 [Planctomycetota bacterium]|nr:MAG: hypothetical protein DHS20C15_27650 [Planctomycetota bacterium]